MGKTVFKVTEEMKEQIVSLYNQGLMDSQIANKIGGITDSAVYYWRKKLGLKTKFDYSQVSKINNEKFEELFNKGLSDYAIAEELGMSPDGIYSYRQRHGYTRAKLIYSKAIPLTLFQKEVLIGTMLGDSSFKKGRKKAWMPSVSCAHCLKQKDYCLYKTEIFKSLGASCKYHKRNKPDKRNGVYYEDYTMIVPANPELKDWYEAFYPKGKKVIPESLFKYFTAVSLAFMFMDDGFKIGQSYKIATNCFTVDEINTFRKMLKSKFNLDTTIHKDNGLYIKASSKSLFENLVSPYLCDCMKYKLHVSLNSVNLGKPLLKGNPNPSFVEIH